MPIPQIPQVNARPLQNKQRKQKIEDLTTQDIANALENAEKAGDQDAAKQLADMLAKKRPDLIETQKKPSKEKGIVSSQQQKTQDDSFLQETGEAFLSRPTFVGAGALTGTALGIPFGPVGALGLGAAGAGVGSVVFDTVQNAKAMIENKPEEIINAIDQFKKAGKESLTDLQWGMAGELAQPIRFSRRLLSRWSGLNNEASKTLQQKAKNLGVNVGAIDVGGGLPKGFGRSVGVFPVTGAPMRIAELGKIKDVERTVSQIAKSAAPAYHTSQAIGTDMFKAAQNTMKNFRNVSEELYNNVQKQVKTAAKEAGTEAIIPTKNIRDYAESLEEALKQGDIKLVAGKNKKLKRQASQQALNFLKKLKKLPDHITMEQFNRLKKEDFSKLFEKHAKSNVDIRYLTKAKGALEMDFRNMDTSALSKKAADRIRKLMRTADSFYAKGQTLFQHPAGKKISRVDKNVFRAGAKKPGMLNADELYNVAINLKSPQQIQDLTKLVGKKNMKKAVRYHWETAVQNAKDTIQIKGQNIDIIDPKKLESQLGIFGAKKHQQEGIKELYKQADIDFKKIEDLIDVINNLERISNPSEFARRRVILGGIAGGGAALAGAGGALYTAGLPGGMITIGGMTLLSRHFSKIFADSQKLKLLTTSLDESLKAGPRKAAYARLIKMLGDKKSDDEIIAEETEQQRRLNEFREFKQTPVQ